MAAMSTKILGDSLNYRCAGQPASINGKDGFGNLGKGGHKDLCSAACLSEPSCLYAVWSREADECTAFSSCSEKASTKKFDVFEKGCATTTTTTLHPCVDGSHGCDTGEGGVCNQVGDDWECACAAGYECVAGCNSPHTGHTCSLVTTTTTTTTLPGGSDSEVPGDATP